MFGDKKCFPTFNLKIHNFDHHEVKLMHHCIVPRLLCNEGELHKEVIHHMFEVKIKHSPHGLI